MITTRFFVLLSVVLFLFLGVKAKAAEPLSVTLESVRLQDLVQVVYGDMLRKNFVIDSPLLADESRVTLKLQGVQSGSVEDQLKQLLDDHGYVISNGSVVRVSAKLKEDKTGSEVFIYRPKFRDVRYLSDIAGGIVPQSGFAVMRGNQVDLQSISGSTPAGNVSQGLASQGINAQADRSSDVLVYRGEKKDIEKLQKLVQQLDVPVGELLVKAYIYEVQKQNHEGSAVDLAVSILSGKIGLDLTAKVDSANAASINVKGLGLEFKGLYQALNSDNRFHLMSSPQVRLTSGGHARFSVGQEVPVLGSVSYDNAGKPIQSVQYKEAGVIFDLSATVRESVSELQVDQQLSQFQTTTTGLTQTPTLVKRQITTKVALKDQDVVVIGGLNEKTNTGGSAGLSFLPAFLRSSSTDQKDTEVLLLLHVQRI